MNISRITKKQSLILAAEAGALNAKATTPEDEARVEELIREAEAVINGKPLECPLLTQMLTGPHPSDGKSPADLFPNIEFECYSNTYSNCKLPGTWGNGWTGDEICARSLCRYKDELPSLEFKEAMTLLAHLIYFLKEHHANTGIGDTEPQCAITDAVNKIFEDVDKIGFRKISRNEWTKYLKLAIKDYIG